MSKKLNKQTSVTGLVEKLARLRKKPNSSFRTDGNVHILRDMVFDMNVMFRKRKRKSSGDMKTSPLEKFRRTVRLVLACISWCRICYERAEQTKNQLLSVTQLAEVPEKTTSGDSLLFDPEYFKANKEQKLPMEAKRILLKSPGKRSEKELKYLQIALRRMQAFAEYPINKQKKICDIGWYESFEPKRAIVRQGHVPQAFYIILSGTVVVTVRDDSTEVTRTVCFLHSGMEFGELALINRSIRQASVLSKTAVELLCVSIEDYEDIFMSGGIRNVSDHTQFFKNIPFLKHFPHDKLYQDPKSVMFSYFNRGRVLVRDSNYSDWIYIVKTGSISVLKKLKRVDTTSECGRSPGSSVTNKSSSHVSIRRTTKARKRSASCPERLKEGKKSMENVIYRSTLDMVKNLEKTLPGITDKRDRLGLIDYESIITEHRQRIMPKYSRLPPIARSESPASVKDDAAQSSSEQDQLHVVETDINKSDKGIYFSTSGKTRERLNSDAGTVISTDKGKTSDKEDGTKNKLEGRLTITDVLESKQPGKSGITEADLRPTFILARVLEKGQYFGVNDIVFRNQPSMSLISNGADCFLLSKKFFLQNANEDILRHVRKTEIPYPSDEELQASLEANVSWEQHRAITYKNMVSNMSVKSRSRKQYSSQNTGHYEFRSRP